jgi:hypothetical protein
MQGYYKDDEETEQEPEEREPIFESIHEPDVWHIWTIGNSTQIGYGDFTGCVREFSSRVDEITALK